MLDSHDERAIIMIHQYLEQAVVICVGISGIGFLIAFHELGHFLACKLFGVDTPQFSIGFGPRIFSFRAHNTLFSLSAIPLGGYVEIAQDNETSIHGRPFSALSWVQKMVIISGGIIFNLIFSLTALTAVFLFDAPPSPLLYPFNGSTTIRSVLPGGIADVAGIQTGDRLLRLNQQDFTDNPKKLSEHLQILRNKSVIIEYERDKIVVSTQIDLPDTEKPLLGVEFSLQPIPAAQSVSGAFFRAVSVTKSMIENLFSFLKSLITCKTTKGLGGPVLMFSQAIQGVRQGAAAFLIMLSFISINLAVMNLIPLPVLDGGQALIITIESIIRRPLSEKLRTILLITTWIFLATLALYLSINDTLHIFAPCIP